MVRLSLRRRKIEAHRFITRELHAVYAFAQHIDSVQPCKYRVHEDGTGELWFPTPERFHRLAADSKPMGIIFRDGSFLVVREVFRYDYPSSDASKPVICHLEYSFHYQRPQDKCYFRYDFHPEYGDAETHPLYHVHANGWCGNERELPEKPRLPVMPISLVEVLEVIRLNYFA